MIDGKIARRFSMVTNLGKILDPLADKATQLTLIVCLSLKYPILIALIALFIVKESFQVIAGAINLQKGIMLKGALISGKICTTILFITLIVLVLIPEIPYPYVVLLSSVDMILMGVTFIDYCITYAKKDHKFQSIDTNN
jgi:cardiolipin synthase